MVYVRSVLFFFPYMLATLVLSVYGVCMFWAPSGAIVWFANIWSACVLWLLKWICGMDVRVEGRENLPKSGRYIIASKHQSAWETITFQHIFGPTNFMSKKEIVWLPLFGFTLWKAGNILVDRGNTTRRGLEKLVAGFKRVLSSRNLVIFPEGTRMAPDAPPSYKNGLAVIASKIPDATIVPIALNSGRFWPKNSFLRRPGAVVVRIGKPIKVADFSDYRSLASAIEHGIESMMKGI